MVWFGQAGMAVLERAIKHKEYGLQEFAAASGVNHMRLKRVMLGGRSISKEEMAMISREIGWPVKYLMM